MTDELETEIAGSGTLDARVAIAGVIVAEIAERDPMVVEKMGSYERCHCRYCDGEVFVRVSPEPPRWVIRHEPDCHYRRACALVGVEMMHRE
jgi:hypothetical protein